jgi:hypothetical protein
MEMRLAAQWSHYTFEKFVELDGEDMAAIIAAYRVNNYADALVAHRASNTAKKK